MVEVVEENTENKLQQKSLAKIESDRQISRNMHLPTKHSNQARCRLFPKIITLSDDNDVKIYSLSVLSC